MNRQTTLSDLRGLDPADGEIDVQSPRARADLARILASAPAPSGTTEPFKATPRRTGRMVLAGGTVAAAAGAFALLPSPGHDQAFASWTASPTAMPAQAAADAADSCREQQQGGPGTDLSHRLDGARTAVAEQRGDWTMVVLAGGGGFSAMCLTNDELGLFSDAWIGSMGTPTGFVAPDPRGLSATDLGTGTVADGDVSLAVGHAGAAVTGLSYESDGHGVVTATVSGGHFALWFPGDELEDAPQHGVEVEVTYRDGTSGDVTLAFPGSGADGR